MVMLAKKLARYPVNGRKRSLRDITPPARFVRGIWWGRSRTRQMIGGYEPCTITIRSFVN